VDDHQEAPRSDRAERDRPTKRFVSDTDFLKPYLVALFVAADPRFRMIAYTFMGHGGDHWVRRRGEKNGDLDIVRSWKSLNAHVAWPRSTRITSASPFKPGSSMLNL
jgi:hypothetical protein